MEHAELAAAYDRQAEANEAAMADWRAEVEEIGRTTSPRNRPPFPPQPPTEFVQVVMAAGHTGSVRSYSGEAPPRWLVQLDPGQFVTDPDNPDAGLVTSRWYPPRDLELA